MNKSIGIVIGVIALVVVAGGIYASINGRNDAMEQKKTAEEDAMVRKTAEEDAMMKKETNDGAVMEEKATEEGAMMKKDDGAMMKKADSLVLNIATSPELGAYLVAGNGMTLYRFTKDAPDVSNCVGECATKWPPYSVSASAPVTLGSRVKGNVSTVTRTDGTIQVLYNGQPLYFWAKDMKIGDTTGNNVNGVWFVVKP